MLLSEEEVKIKTRLWFAENGDYLKEQEGIYIYFVFVVLLTTVVRRERLAALKADKEREKKVSLFCVGILGKSTYILYSEPSSSIKKNKGSSSSSDICRRGH